MIETSISKLLQGTQLQKFQNDIETKLKLFSIPQLRKFRNLRFALISIGMKECEVDEFIRMIDSQWRNNNNNNNWSNNHMRRLEGISSQSKQNGRCCSSLPTSPCEDFMPLLTSRPYTYPSSFKPHPSSFKLHPLSPSHVNHFTHRGGGDDDDDRDSRCEVVIHSPRCCCESCCNKRNEEYVVWYRADDLKNKKHQSMTRPSEEETADDVSKTLEIIYTKHPNKFVVPEGNAFDIRSYNPLKCPRDGIVDSPQPSPSSPEKSPSKFGFKINLGWKNKSKTSQDPLNNQPKSNLSHKASLIFRQRSQDDNKSKASGSTPVDGSHFPSPFTKIQEALGKRKNKPSLRINVPNDENVYTNTNIKPMSANAERKMREALEEIAKLRNNNSPKSPAYKSTKDSPTKSSFSFKFPHIKGSSSKNKEKCSSSSTGDQSPTISTSSSNSRGSSSSFNRTAQVRSKDDLMKVASSNRLSSISSSSSQKSFGYDQVVSKRCFKVKSRLSRRTTSECRPRAGSSSSMFTPYLAVKSRSVEFKVHKHQTPTNDSLVINQLAGNPLLHPQKSRNKKSVNEDTSTEFILRFNSTLTLQNESNMSSPDKDNSAENSNSSSCTLKEEDFNASRKMQKSRALSPPPDLPPRVPIKYKRSVPCLSYRESIKRKPVVGSTKCNPIQTCHQSCSMTLTRNSSHFSQYEKNPNVHTAVPVPLKSKHTPRVVISGSTATYKSYDHIPSHRPMIGSYPPDHRFSADASTFVRRIQSALNESDDKNEDEFPISNSSSECRLDESNSYEDLMEQALDSKINDENDMQYIQDGSKFNFTAPFNKRLENCEWTIPEPRKHYARGNTTALSPCQEKTVLVGNF